MQAQWLLINNAAEPFSLARVCSLISLAHSRAQFACAFFFHVCIAVRLCTFLRSICFDILLKHICGPAFVCSCRMLIKNNFFSQLTALLFSALDYQNSDLSLQLICADLTKASEICIVISDFISVTWHDEMISFLSRTWSAGVVPFWQWLALF